MAGPPSPPPPRRALRRGRGVLLRLGIDARLVAVEAGEDQALVADVHDAFVVVSEAALVGLRRGRRGAPA